MRTRPARSRFQLSDFGLTPPLVSLLSANLLTLVLAIAGNWDAATVIFIYWAQSVLIGIFTVVTILGADTAAITADKDARDRERGEQVSLDPRRVRGEKHILAVIFAIHYGLFHLAYYSFIVGEGLFGVVDFADPGIWYSCGFFFVNHLFSFLYYHHRVREGEDFMNTAFITPYFRIVPMHLTIMFGAVVILILQAMGIASTLPVLVLFLLLKTGADLAMHVWKHGG
jgi:hypothetical protein